MITLHESNITSFPHDNGIGVLKDVIRAYAEEELNGLFEFYMEYDSEGHLVDELKEERIIKAKAQDKLGYQLFRIYSITKNHENDNLIVRAQHITYDLADNFVESLVANNLTKKQVMELIGSSTVLPHPFFLTSSNTTTRSSTKLYRTNPLQMIGGMEGSILQIWGGQIERDNFNLILHDRRGSDDGVKVTYEKNITGLEATFDISGLVTRIFPFVYIEETDNEPSRLITVNGKYIDSPHINDYEKIYIKPIDYSNDERINLDGTDAQIRQQLTEIASKYFEETGNDKIKVDMEVQFEHLWETEECKDLAVLEHVGMGDTVTIEHSRLKVDATAIVNYIRYDCIAEKNEEVRLGSVKARLTDNVNKVVDVAEKAERAEQTANQAIRTANGKNTIYYGPDEPEGGIEGDLWFRVVDGEYTRTYRHDGIQWQLVLSVDVRDAIDEAQQAKDDAQEAVNRANQATQQATNAINQAQTAFDEAQAALSTANNALTQANSAFSLANDAFSEVTALSTIVDENTGEISTIKQSVIGLQTRVSDNEGNISNLTQIAQGLQSQVSDIEGNVSTLTQTAQGLQSTVSSLQDELHGLEIGGRNLIRNSDFSDGNKYWAGNFTRVVKDGKNAIEMVGNDSINLVGVGENQYFLLEPNTTYTYQVEIMVDTQIEVSNSAPLHYHIRADDDTKGGREWIVLKSPSVLTPNKWHKIILQFKTKDITSPITFTPYIYRMPAGVKFWITYFKLEKGNKATDWTPAPEDVDHQFSVITQTIDSITTRIGDVEGNITALQQTSSSLAARLTSAEGDITTITATVNGLQTTVSNIEGDVSSVTQLANALQVRMTDAEGNISTLTQTASSLQSTVTNLQNDFDNLEIGGRNLLRNSHFNGLNYWAGNGTATITIENGYLKVIFGQSLSTPGLKYIPQVTLDKGFYTASAKVNVENLSRPLRFYVLPNYIGTDVLQGGETGWRIITWTFEVTADQDTGAFYLLSRGTSSTDYMLVEWIKLEKGNRATDWTPAPEDMATQSQITQLSDAINLRVEKGDVINQINISDESILIDGKRIHITGQTTIDDAAIKSAHIESLDGGKITAGSIDAGKLNVTSLSAISANLGEVTAGTIRGINIYGGTIEGTVLKSSDTPAWDDPNYTTKASIQSGWLQFWDKSLGAELRLNVTGAGIELSGVHPWNFVPSEYSPSSSTYTKIHNASIRVENPDGGSKKLFISADKLGIGASTNVSFEVSAGILGSDATVKIGNYTLKSEFMGQYLTLSGGKLKADIVGTLYASASNNYIANNGEARVVWGLGYNGGIFEYRPIRASSFPTASLAEHKEDIHPWQESALEKIRQATIYEYYLKSELEQGICRKRQGLVIGEGYNTPEGIIDGDGVEQYLMNAWSWKAIQELDSEQMKMKDEIEWLKLENQYLRQKVKQLEEMIA